MLHAIGVLLADGGEGGVEGRGQLGTTGYQLGFTEHCFFKHIMTDVELTAGGLTRLEVQVDQILQVLYPYVGGLEIFLLDLCEDQFA